MNIASKEPSRSAPPVPPATLLLGLIRRGESSSTFPFVDEDLLEARQEIERLEKQNFELRIQNTIVSCESESKIWLSSKVLLVEIAENHLETLKSELSEDERRLVDLGLEELKKGQENLEMEEGEMDDFKGDVNRDDRATNRVVDAPQPYEWFTEQTIILGDELAKSITHNTKSTVSKIGSVEDLDTWSVRNNKPTTVIVALSHETAARHGFQPYTCALRRLIRRVATQSATRFFVVAPPPMKAQIHDYDHLLKLLECVAQTENQRFVCSMGRLSLVTYYFFGNDTDRGILENGALALPLRRYVTKFLEEVARLPLSTKSKNAKGSQ
ncbi:hypothetical protein L596_013626 [Steinernema carpocapsae]|uniref:Uncharacterized protein n=1 Tax=Steinernema carpocapsae TaxID=34508 RepID=A0A4U5P171_STECR|nr:hypothetical protein L596_013626 [Steinernema carpocapsae]